MNLRLSSLGLIVLCGCAGSPPGVPNATAPTEPVAKSTVGGRPYTLSVPNMT